MRIGYLFRGFLADVKLDAAGNELSTPDGNATYSWCIEHECERRKHRLIPLGPNLDAPAGERLGEGMFAAYSQEKRCRSYERMIKRGWMRGSDRGFPDLDLVLVEWRWPIPGRNTQDDLGKPGYQDDLVRQEAVLRHYSDRGTPIVAWDLDHKISQADEMTWFQSGIGAIIETSVRPKLGLIPRYRVDPPFVTEDLLQHPIDDRMPSHHLGYIGSRYERDETIDKWIGSIAPPNTHRVKFWGKWEPADEVRARWPGVTFEGRIGVQGFRAAYSRVAAVPLLAKQSYYDCGFVTPRMAEAVLFGSIPIGLAGHRGIEEYAAHVASDPKDLLDIATRLRTISPMRRSVFREEAAHKLSRVDARNFVDVLERLGSGGVAATADEEESEQNV